VAGWRSTTSRSCGLVTGPDLSFPCRMPNVAVHDCTPDRWNDVVAVFEGRGDPARCWCQWFYRGAQADWAHAEANRAALHEQVQGQRPPGVLGYLDDIPTGRCAVAPRPTCTRLPPSTVR